MGTVGAVRFSIPVRRLMITVPFLTGDRLFFGFEALGSVRSGGFFIFGAKK